MSTLHSASSHAAAGRRAGPALRAGRRLARLGRMVRGALVAAALASASPAIAGEDPAPVSASQRANRFETPSTPGALAMGTGGGAGAERPGADEAPRPQERADRKVGEDPYDRAMDAAG